MRKDLQALVEIYPSAKIYITGFTSGGSIATIAALDVKAIIGRADQLYTFGQSRVGNEVFATFVTSRVT
jgi:predicted lipase